MPRYSPRNVRQVKCGDVFHDHSLDGDGSGEHWFQLQSPSSGGYLEVDTCLSEFDTKLAIFGPSSSTLAASNDDDHTGYCHDRFQDPSSLNAVIEHFSMAPNQEYMIQIEGYSTDDGQYYLELQCF